MSSAAASFRTGVVDKVLVVEVAAMSAAVAALLSARASPLETR